MTEMPWGRVSICGRDAAALLQGQLTQDVNTADGGHAPLAGWCTPKGRLLALCRVLVPAPERFELAVPAELTAALARRLTMYVLRAQATVTDEGAGWDRTIVTADSAKTRGIVLEASPTAALEAEGCWWIRLPGEPACLEVLGPVAAVAALALPESARVSRITAGLPSVYAATSEAFIPQMLNLDVIGAVSFRKGCYTGQEIVARTQNLGRIKRRMARYVADRPLDLAPGERLMATATADDDATAVAQVVDCAGTEVLAVVALDHAGMPLRAAGGEQLTPGPLPYAVPELPDP